MTKEVILKLWYSGLSKSKVAIEEFKDLKRHNYNVPIKELKQRALKNVEDVLIQEWFNLSKKK